MVCQGYGNCPLPHPVVSVAREGGCRCEAGEEDSIPLNAGWTMAWVIRVLGAISVIAIGAAATALAHVGGKLFSRFGSGS